MKRTEIQREVQILLDPEKYGYTVCTHCNGYGSSLKETADTCTKCGGSGLVLKKETDDGSRI